MFWPWNHGDPENYYQEWIEKKNALEAERNDNMALIGETEKMELKMKAKMTRKEAIDKISHFTVNIKYAEAMIDFYIEAGMLEIVEEPKIKVKALLLKDCDGQFRLIDVLEIISRLTDYGWKVIE